MNAGEKKLIARMHNVLFAVPHAQDGSGGMSASVEGFVTYSNDMRRLLKPLRLAMFEMACPNPDLSKDEVKIEIEEHLKEAERFIEKRKAENWS